MLQNLSVVRLERVVNAMPPNAFSSQELALLCVEELGRYWRTQLVELKGAKVRVQQAREILREVWEITLTVR